jgi:hypothetical protein
MISARILEKKRSSQDLPTTKCCSGSYTLAILFPTLTSTSNHDDEQPKTPFLYSKATQGDEEDDKNNSIYKIQKPKTEKERVPNELKENESR